MADVGSVIEGPLRHPPQGDAVSGGLVLFSCQPTLCLLPLWASVSPFVQGLDSMISKHPSFPDRMCKVRGPIGFGDFLWL